MFTKFKKEILVFSLLLSTLTVIFANQFFERSFELNVDNFGQLAYADDQLEGGASEAYAEPLADVFRFEYQIDNAAFENAHSSLVLFPGEKFVSNMSWLDRVEIVIRSSNPDGVQVLFHVRDFERGISSLQDRTSLKYNEALLSVSNELETVTVKRDEFLVPTWWKQKYDVKGDATYPSFSNVDSFEFTVNSSAGEIDVASIRCVGNWVDSATLNQCLLWMWLGGTLLGVIYRMSTLKKRLDCETASAKQLLMHNNLLISESATYHELARRDPLTGLLNRYGLEGEFEGRSSDYYFNYTMILFDLDHFKAINDNLGHCYGDRVLFDIARVVKSKLNKNDMVARWGGDEFLVILSDRDTKEAFEFAEEIRHAVSKSDLDYSCSFGICTSEVNKTFESTLCNADSALYDSKDNGRNSISVYQEDKRQSLDGQDDGEDEVPIITLVRAETPSTGFAIYE